MQIGYLGGAVLALLELPRGCDYWNDERMKCMINGTDSYIHDFHGCMHGLTTQFGDQRIPIKKPWRIVSWGVSPCYTHYYIIGWIGILTSQTYASCPSHDL